MNLTVALLLAVVPAPCPGMDLRAVVACEATRQELIVESTGSITPGFAKPLSFHETLVSERTAITTDMAEALQPAGGGTRRPRWLVPAIGAVVGAGIGALIARSKDSGGDVFFDLYSLYVPIGAVGGALVGAVVDREMRR